MDIKNTLKLWLFTSLKIPMIASLRPRVLEVNDDVSRLLIPISRRSQNHLKSMFFGALCTGADVTQGLLTFSAIEKSKRKISVIVQEFTAEFLKRAEDDVEFKCEDGQKISQLIARSIETGERQSEKITVTASVPRQSKEELVAKFSLTISVKLKSKMN